ncbi:MAG TPA: hypothetical protein VMN81_10040 [Vicinamibacterales bacterium]|nr:hypothetical protein [Vicinamibacterales bacterium]
MSPASCAGRRAAQLLSPRARFDLAVRLREGQAEPIGEIFQFLSGLYFRGKLAYARAFARPPAEWPSGVFVITTGAGLVEAETAITADAIRGFAGIDISASNAAYREPLERTARGIVEEGGGDMEVVLLGSIASGKYVDVLGPIFGERLVFPPAFVGRGDMSRGGLMLRAARSGEQLEYVPVAGAVRHGARPPKLDPLKRKTVKARR